MAITEQEFTELRNQIVDEVRGLKAKFDEDFKATGQENEALKTQLANAQAEFKRVSDEMADLKAQWRAAPGRGTGNGQDAKSEQELLRRKAFNSFLRKGSLELLTADEQKALVEDATGRVLVPEELEAEIMRELPKVTIMRGLCAQRTIRGERLRRRSMTEVTVGWGKLETGAALPESTLVPSDEWQYVEDLNGLTKVGKDELSDADTPLDVYISESFARAFGETEDKAFMIGTGHDHEQPEGIFVSSALTPYTINAGQAAAVKMDDFVKLRQALPAQYRTGASWLMNSMTEQALLLLKEDATSNKFIWEPSNQAGAPNLLLGYPVYDQEDIPDIPRAGSTALVAAFGNWRAGYRIVDRAGIAIQRIAELYATAGLIGFLATKRVTGGIIRPAAIRRLNIPAA